MSEEQIGQSPSSKKKEIEFLTYTREARARIRERKPHCQVEPLSLFKHAPKTNKKGTRRGGRCSAGSFSHPRVLPMLGGVFGRVVEGAF